MKYLKPVARKRIYNKNYVYKLQKKYNINDVEVLSRLFHLLIALDEVADKIDKPPHWLIPDPILYSIALSNPDNLEKFKKLIYKKDGLQTERELISSTIYKVLSNDQQIEPLTNWGYSIRRWEYLGNDIQHTGYHPENVINIKLWRTLIANKLKILPGMVLDKRFISIYSIDIDSLDQKIVFPGITANFHQLLLNDLLHFLNSGESLLSRDNFLN